MFAANLNDICDLARDTRRRDGQRPDGWRPDKSKLVSHWHRDAEGRLFCIWELV